MTLKEIKRVLKNESRGIISIIKISKKKDEIEKELKKLFKIIKIIEEEKDLIYYFQKYNY
jgi:ubiquinone/menaquinone biosynthesis C-methylase UbiE